MLKNLIPISMFCFIAFGGNAYADTSSAPTVPTEVGTSKMPPGNYLVIDQNSGNKYSLEVTSKGTMILGPAPATAAGTTAVSTTPAAAAPAAATSTPATATTSKAASGVKGLAEKEAQKFIMNKGMSEIQNFVK